VPITAQTNLYGVTAADVSLADFSLDGLPMAALRLGPNVTVFLKDLATVDALMEAITKAYELLAQGAIDAGVLA
jgi:hypothetical protein